MWFLARPFLASRSEWAIGGIPAAVLVGGTLAALLWTFMKRPPAVAASLALDQQFDLKERITTYFLLSADQAESPAGAALLGDVKEKLLTVNVPSRFPVGVRWSQAMM